MPRFSRRLCALLCVLLAGESRLPAQIGSPADELVSIHEECREEFYRGLRLDFGVHELQFRLTAHDIGRLRNSEERLPGLFEAVLRVLYPGERAGLESLLDGGEQATLDEFRGRYLDLCRRAAGIFVESLFVERQVREGRSETTAAYGGMSRLDRILRFFSPGAGQDPDTPALVTIPILGQPSRHWGYEVVRLREAHRTTRGAGIRVAVVGSGIDRSSELVADLRLDLSASTSLVDWSGSPWSSTAATLEDPTGAGTLMAAFVGLYAPEAEVLVVRVSGEDDPMYPFWPAMLVAQAIYHAVAEGADIIVVGASFDRDFDFLRRACNFAYDHHAVIVAPTRALAAPLDRMSQFPAHYNTVVAVAGALPAPDGRASPWEGSGLSNFNSVAAPASWLAREDFSATDSSDPLVLPNASLAVAAVGGVVALIASLLEPAETELRGQYFQRLYEILTRSANPGVIELRSFSPTVGYGMIDAAAAVGPELQKYLDKMKGIEESFAARLQEVNKSEEDRP